MAEKQLMMPADPVCGRYVAISSLSFWVNASSQPLTDRELLNCHAAVKALQTQFGISYKDASHRLFLAEVEKLEHQTSTLRTYADLKERMEASIQSFERRLAGHMRGTLPDDKDATPDIHY